MLFCSETSWHIFGLVAYLSVFHASWWCIQNSLKFWYGIRFVETFKHFIPYCSWYFKCVVFGTWYYILRSDNVTPSLLLRKSVLRRLSLSLCASVVLLNSEFMNIALMFIMIWVSYCVLSFRFVLLDTMNRNFV